MFSVALKFDFKIRQKKLTAFDQISDLNRSQNQPAKNGGDKKLKIRLLKSTKIVFLIAVVFWVKFPEFEPKEWPRRERPAELSPFASRNLVTQPLSRPGSRAV